MNRVEKKVNNLIRSYLLDEHNATMRDRERAENCRDCECMLCEKKREDEDKQLSVEQIVEREQERRAIDLVFYVNSIFKKELENHWKEDESSSESSDSETSESEEPPKKKSKK